MLSQLVNAVVDGFKPCSIPSHTAIVGQHCTLVPVDADSIKLHGAALYSEYCKEGDKTWTYLPYGPFGSCEQYLAWLLSLAERREGLTNDAIPCVPRPQPLFIMLSTVNIMPGSSLWSVLPPWEFVHICARFQPLAASRLATSPLRLRCAAQLQRLKQFGILPEAS